MFFSKVKPTCKESLVFAMNSFMKINFKLHRMSADVSESTYLAPFLGAYVNHHPMTLLPVHLVPQPENLLGSAGQVCRRVGCHPSSPSSHSIVVASFSNCRAGAFTVLYRSGLGFCKLVLVFVKFLLF